MDDLSIDPRDIIIYHNELKKQNKKSFRKFITLSNL